MAPGRPGSFPGLEAKTQTGNDFRCKFPPGSGSPLALVAKPPKRPKTPDFGRFWPFLGVLRDHGVPCTAGRKKFTLFWPKKRAIFGPKNTQKMAKKCGFWGVKRFLHFLKKKKWKNFEKPQKRQVTCFPGQENLDINRNFLTLNLTNFSLRGSWEYYSISVEGTGTFFFLSIPQKYRTLMATPDFCRVLTPQKWAPFKAYFWGFLRSGPDQQKSGVMRVRYPLSWPGGAQNRKFFEIDDFGFLSLALDAKKSKKIHLGLPPLNIEFYGF